MSAGASKGSYYELIIPENTIPGIYYLGYILDFKIKIVESDKTNNTDYAEVKVEEPLSGDDGLPDLAVDFVGVDRKSVVSGETIRAEFKRSNTGDKDSGSFAHGLYLSADEIITTADRQLVYSTAYNMSAGTSEGSFYEVIIPEYTPPGTYYLGYILDFKIQIVESDETNNTGYAEITVVEPILEDDGALVLGGLGVIAGTDIRHPNGNVFDQILLTGPSIKLQAKPS